MTPKPSEPPPAATPAPVATPALAPAAVSITSQKLPAVSQKLPQISSAEAAANWMKQANEEQATTVSHSAAVNARAVSKGQGHSVSLVCSKVKFKVTVSQALAVNARAVGYADQFHAIDFLFLKNISDSSTVMIL